MDGVIVTIAMEGPDVGGAGPLWWRAKVDAPSWGGRGGSGEDWSGGDWQQFLHSVLVDSGMHGGLIGMM